VIEPLPKTDPVAAKNLRRFIACIFSFIQSPRNAKAL